MKVLGAWLELDLEGEPISGTLRLQDDITHPFVGWLGLSVVLEALRRTPVHDCRRDRPCSDVSVSK